MEWFKNAAKKMSEEAREFADQVKTEFRAEVTGTASNASAPGQEYKNDGTYYAGNKIEPNLNQPVPAAVIGRSSSSSSSSPPPRGQLDSRGDKFIQNNGLPANSEVRGQDDSIEVREVVLTGNKNNQSRSSGNACSESETPEQVASYPTLMSMAASQQSVPVSMTGSRTSDDFVMVHDDVSPPRDDDS